MQTAGNRVEEKLQALADLEADMAEELAAIVDEWDVRATAVEPLEVPWSGSRRLVRWGHPEMRCCPPVRPAPTDLVSEVLLHSLYTSYDALRRRWSG